MVVVVPVSRVYWTYPPSGFMVRIWVLREGERLIKPLVQTTPEETSTDDASDPELNAARRYETGPERAMFNAMDVAHPVEVTQYSWESAHPSDSERMVPL